MPYAPTLREFFHSVGTLAKHFGTLSTGEPNDSDKLLQMTN
jgi:hypothetical protein